MTLRRSDIVIDLSIPRCQSRLVTDLLPTDLGNRFTAIPIFPPSRRLRMNISQPSTSPGVGQNKLPKWAKPTCQTHKSLMPIRPPTDKRGGAVLFSIRCDPAFQLATNMVIAVLECIYEESLMTISRSLVVAFCVLGSLAAPAHGSNLNSEATYIRFGIPGGATYPMAINSSMTVAGYYQISNTQARGFIRAADGTIETFAVPGAVWTEPESINAAGDIAGFWEMPAVGMDKPTKGFLRYADGHIITFDPQTGTPPAAQAVSVNDFDELVGTVYANSGSYGFARLRDGMFSTQIFPDAETVATAINDSGSAVGYAFSYITALNTGYVIHPDGYTLTFTVSLPSSDAPCTTGSTSPMAINVAGTIAGWYEVFCPPYPRNGFVRSPEGLISVFSFPGLVYENNLAINQVGDVTGSYTDTKGNQHGFVRSQDGVVTTFDEPDALKDTTHITQPTGINDLGVITGTYGGAGMTGFLRIPN
jgi:hypothetical protein